MHPEVREALKTLRRHARNARTRANRRLKGRQYLYTFRQAHSYDTQVYNARIGIEQIDEAFKRMAKLDKDAANEREAIKQLPKDKTAGRNFLRPELGR